MCQTKNIQQIIKIKYLTTILILLTEEKNKVKWIVLIKKSQKSDLW